MCRNQLMEELKMPRTATRLLDDLIATPPGMGGTTNWSARHLTAGRTGSRSAIAPTRGYATNGLAGPLSEMLLGGRKPRTTAPFDFKLSGVHLVGGLAYRAWRDWKANRQPTFDAEPDLINIPRGTTFLPMKASKIESLGRKLIRAMIAAAKADGRITHHECRRLKEWLGQQDCLDADRDFIDFELRNPLDVNAVAQSGDSLEIAAEIYLASQFALEPGGVAEWFHLHRLATRMGLDPEFVAHLRAQFENPAPMREQLAA